MFIPFINKDTIYIHFDMYFKYYQHKLKNINKNSAKKFPLYFGTGCKLV